MIRRSAEGEKKEELRRRRFDAEEQAHKGRDQEKEKKSYQKQEKREQRALLCSPLSLAPLILSNFCRQEEETGGEAEGDGGVGN